jgi:NTP pyrophosphatase (non-canonical NTP hydrolase)
VDHVDSIQNINQVFTQRMQESTPLATTLQRYLSDPRVVEALGDIIMELSRAEVKHPIWPEDMVHAVAILAGEAGECLKAANHYREGRDTEGEDSFYSIKREAIQTGAMTVRLLINLPELEEVAS